MFMYEVSIWEIGWHRPRLIDILLNEKKVFQFDWTHALASSPVMPIAFDELEKAL